MDRISHAAAITSRPSKDYVGASELPCHEMRIWLENSSSVNGMNLKSLPEGIDRFAG